MTGRRRSIGAPLALAIVSIALVSGCGSSSSNSTTTQAAAADPVSCMSAAGFENVESVQGASQPQWRGHFSNPSFVVVVDKLGSPAAASTVAKQSPDSLTFVAQRYAIIGPASRPGGSTMSDRNLLRAKLALHSIVTCLNGGTITNP